jgi:hypothetical protein
MSGFTTPGTIVKYDLALPEKERKLETWRTTVLKGLNPSEFSAEQARHGCLPERVAADFTTGLVREQRWDQSPHVHRQAQLNQA